MSLTFYKQYNRPIALGFDLDDTLYDNRPVLLQAEQQLQHFLHTHFAKTQQLSFDDWLILRQQVVAQQPALQHDITASRRWALHQGLSQLGYRDEVINDGVNRAMETFLHWRNQVSITPSIHCLLSRLQQQFRLFVISNGNADIEQLGLSQYFEFALHPSANTPMKPASELFSAAQNKLQLTGAEIAYIGDHPVSDIIGANNAGWQSIWLNVNNSKLDHYKKPLQLPTIEMTKLDQLAHLISI